MGNILNRTYKLGINYYGTFEWGDGYGTSNMHWAKALDRQGVKIFPKFTFDIGERYNIEGEPEETEILNRPFEKRKIGIIETPPTFFDSCVNEIKIGSTMTEADRICKEWVANCNKMDYLILPTKWQEEAFRRSGVTVPILIIPFGSEVESFPYYERPKRDVFTFGSVGWFMPLKETKDRKNFWKMIQAFVSEFEPDEPVQLLLKTVSDEAAFYVNWKDPRIKVVDKPVTREQLNEYYRKMDCFLFPSRGEGVGQPPREAMSTGLPCILTNYSSLTEIALPDISYPLSYTTSQRQDMEYEPGMWADIDVRELMYQMRYVYEHQDEAKEKGKKASDFIRKNFTWDKSAKKLKQFLRTL